MSRTAIWASASLFFAAALLLATPAGVAKHDDARRRPRARGAAPGAPDDAPPQKKQPPPPPTARPQPPPPHTRSQPPPPTAQPQPPPPHTRSQPPRRHGAGEPPRAARSSGYGATSPVMRHREPVPPPGAMRQIELQPSPLHRDAGRQENEPPSEDHDSAGKLDSLRGEVRGTGQEAARGPSCPSCAGCDPCEEDRHRDGRHGDHYRGYDYYYGYGYGYHDRYAYYDYARWYDPYGYGYGPYSGYESAGGHDEDDNGLLTFLGWVLAWPLYLPYVGLGDQYGRSCAFAPHPYAGGGSGYLLVDRGAQLEGAAAVGAKSWGMTVAADVAYQSDDILRFTGAARLIGPSRLDLDTAWSHYREALPGRDDRLTIGDVNLLVRFAQSPRVQFRAGGGARVLLDRGGPAYGFNFTYGAELFPVQPLVISLTGDVGHLGSALVLGGRATAGVMFQAAEIFAGYDHLQVGEVGLGGPMAGVRAWF